MSFGMLIQWLLIGLFIIILILLGSYNLQVVNLSLFSMLLIIMVGLLIYSLAKLHRK